MPTVLPPADFLAAPGVVLDARSPAEFEQGHIPGAISFPLFDNEERARVGICYKHEGQEKAIELGLEIVGPKLATFVQQAKSLAPDRRVRLHCWRGGMRSGSMAQLLETAGLKVQLLEGGYKAFRRWVRSTLAIPRPMFILAGMTGTGKTAVLTALAALGEQVLDLEGLANHRGSSYGNLGLPAQPTTEQYENLIALQWQHFDAQRPVWLEAESRQVGTCRIPEEIFHPMMQAEVVQVERSPADRLHLLLEDYGQADLDELIAATERLRKRLGGKRTQEAIAAIRNQDSTTAINIVLSYYDKTYYYDLQQRNSPLCTVDITGLSATEAANLLIEKVSFYRR
jgi:tRNA 2-selenouridine synthase